MMMFIQELYTISMKQFPIFNFDPLYNTWY